MVFGHSTRSLAPAHRSAFAVEWHLSMEESGMTLTLVIGIFENRDRCIHSRFKVKRVESGGCDCECWGGVITALSRQAVPFCGAIDASFVLIGN